jgi:hypothetical protein
LNRLFLQPWLVALIAALLAAVLAGGTAGLWWICRHAPGAVAGGAMMLADFSNPTALALWLAAGNRKRAALFALCITMLVSIIPFTVYGNAWLGSYRSMRDFVQEYEQLAGRADTVYSGFRTLNSLVFYLRRPVVVDTDSKSLAKSLTASKSWICFVPAKKYEENRNALSFFFCC